MDVLITPEGGPSVCREMFELVRDCDCSDGTDYRHLSSASWPVPEPGDDLDRDDKEEEWSIALSAVSL